MKTPLFGSLVLALAALAGCATVTFKPGAGPGAMSSDEQACRGSTKDEAGFEQCMRDRGWFVAKPGEPSPARAATQPAVAKPEAAPAPAAGTEKRKAAPAAAEPPAVTAPPSAAAEAASPPAGMPTEVDPLKRVEVASWWKLGGSTADLDRAIDICVAKLGEEHRPAPGATVVTAGMKECLRAAGWRSFGGSTAQ